MNRHNINKNSIILNSINIKAFKDLNLFYNSYKLQTPICNKILVQHMNKETIVSSAET